MKSSIVIKITLFVALFCCAIPVVSAAKYECQEISDTIDGGTIYLGTKRAYSVWLPRQYDGKTAACLLLCLDGDIYNIKEDVEQMIEARRMPIAVCVFLQPGVICDEAGCVVRYNRSNEFDAIDGKFAEYIESVLLPKVQCLKSPDGRKIVISDNPDDRCAIGASSGGIASFSLAWNRPDLFRRVYSSVGTFVAMRGGNEFPALVRKTEPKPLRIFLHDGRNDVWNPIFGHWFEYNRIMESALRFAGYDVMHVWDDTGHSIRGGKREFVTAMEWLWRDYPHPLRIGATENELLSDLLIEGEVWKKESSAIEFPLYNECRLSDGRTFADKDHTMAVSPDNRLLVKSSTDSDWLESYVIYGDSLLYGQRFYWLHNTRHCNQSFPRIMQFDSNGNLFVATDSGLQICDQNGRVRGVLTLPSYGLIEDMLVADGCIYLKQSGVIYSRKLNMKGYLPAQKPFNPESQGQG